jgi:hypothetical protein
VGKAFFPLDEELGLLSSRVTPHAHECAVRLGAQMPFEKAAREVGWILGVKLSEPSVRRHTESAGAAYVAWQAAEVERLERETPAAPVGPEKMLMSTDGAMVPLVGGEWAEVKTVVLGEIGEPVLEQGEWVVHSRKHSYFSRLMEAKEFRRQALVETHCRGVETARAVVAVMDGAEWGQGFTDYHRLDATRVLDFPHAAEYVCEIGQSVWGEGTPTSQEWMNQQLHLLKHAGPEDVLAEIRHLGEQNPSAPKLRENQAYLEKRENLMQYPDYQRRGFPIGSGTVESGNKVVVEARLKGAGMHWARPHVNPVLGLRNALCSERWEAAWAQILTQLQLQSCEHRRKRHQKKQAARSAPVNIEENRATAVLEPNQAAPTTPAAVHVPPDAPATPKQPWRPPANHPWRRTPLSRPKLPPADYPSKN